MILGALLLDFNCLFPKPIMAKNVLAIGAHLFKLPEDLRECKSMNLFKYKLDRLLLRCNH